MWYLDFVSVLFKAVPPPNHILLSHSFLSSTHRRLDVVIHVEIQNLGNYHDLYRGETVTTLGELVRYYLENPGTLREKSGRVIELNYPLNCEEVVTTERWAWHIQLHNIYAKTPFTNLY